MFPTFLSIHAPHNGLVTKIVDHIDTAGVLRDSKQVARGDTESAGQDDPYYSRMGDNEDTASFVGSNDSIHFAFHAHLEIVEAFGPGDGVIGKAFSP